MTPEQIAEDVRVYAETLPMGDIHIEIAISAGVQMRSAEHGRIVAERIARKLESIRHKFSARLKYEGEGKCATQS
jgi:hypothetical protein